MAAIITVGVNRAAPGGDSQKCTSCSQTFACLAGQGFSMIWTGLTATAYEKDLNSSLCYPLWSIEMLHASFKGQGISSAGCEHFMGATFFTFVDKPAVAVTVAGIQPMTPACPQYSQLDLLPIQLSLFFLYNGVVRYSKRTECRQNPLLGRILNCTVLNYCRNNNSSDLPRVVKKRGMDQTPPWCKHSLRPMMWWSFRARHNIRLQPKTVPHRLPILSVINQPAGWKYVSLKCMMQENNIEKNAKSSNVSKV